MADTITVGEYDDPHTVGDADCFVGWCTRGVGPYPHPCEREGCSGLVHAEFFEETWDGYLITTKCDVCGEPE
jgi:hypothetical protein